jgi:hypothetical protein
LCTRIGHQAVQPGALVDFVEVGNGLAPIEHALAVAAFHRRTIGVVERAFDEVARGHQILEPLLVLNADRVATEVVGDPHGRDVHLALHEDLVLGQVGLVRSGRC